MLVLEFLNSTFRTWFNCLNIRAWGYPMQFSLPVQKNMSLSILRGISHLICGLLRCPQPLKWHWSPIFKQLYRAWSEIYILYFYLSEVRVLFILQSIRKEREFKVDGRNCILNIFVSYCWLFKETESLSQRMHGINSTK